MKLPTPPKTPNKKSPKKPYDKTVCVQLDPKPPAPKKAKPSDKQPPEKTARRKQKDESALDVWNDEAKTLGNIGGG